MLKKHCVWKGEMENRDDKINVVVKFAKNYCETVHKYLASVEWPRPLVHHTEHLPAG